MIIKTYKCPIHGEFDHEMDIGDEELKECLIPILEVNTTEPTKYTKYTQYCRKPVTRVFKPIYYTDCIGFAGRHYGKG